MIDSRMPFISAVTPCWNDAAHLPEMIESFLAQDYPHKELFVQDGGSTDGPTISYDATRFAGVLRPMKGRMTRLTRRFLPAGATLS